MLQPAMAVAVIVVIMAVVMIVIVIMGMRMIVTMIMRRRMVVIMPVRVGVIMRVRVALFDLRLCARLEVDHGRFCAVPASTRHTHGRSLTSLVAGRRRRAAAMAA